MEADYLGRLSLSPGVSEDSAAPTTPTSGGDAAAVAAAALHYRADHIGLVSFPPPPPRRRALKDSAVIRDFEAPNGLASMRDDVARC